MRRRIIAGAIVVAGLATAGIAYADNQPADPSISVVKAAATGAPAPAAAGGKAGVLKGAIHGDLLVRNPDGSTHTVTFDRGKVGAISSSSITVQRPDGVSVTDDLTDQTVFNGTPKDQLQAGSPVIVVADGHTATHVVTKGARAGALSKACATDPANGNGNAVGPANGNGNAAGQGIRARIKERICQRLEQRQQRRAGKAGAAGAGGGQAGVPGQAGASGAGSVGGGAGGSAGNPSVGPSSTVDDGSETIVS